MKTKKCNVQFRGYGTIELPAGLAVSKIVGGSTDGRFFLDVFPAEIFPKDSMILHDAIHYGVVLSADQVEESRGMK